MRQPASLLGLYGNRVSIVFVVKDVWSAKSARSPRLELWRLTE
jgi:hypothetical protein